MWLDRNLRLIRNYLGLALGTFIGLNETTLSPPPNEYALLFAIGCLAGTFALWSDERGAGDKK